MIIEILLLIAGILLGAFIASWLVSRQKWGDKAEALNERWKTQIAQLEKEYEVKLEKSQSFIDKIKEENKTHLEKLAGEWQLKYVRDIEELKKLFKDSEKIIKTKSVSSSRRSLVGKFIERFVPFLRKMPYEPSDMHFLGQPVDYIVFQGLHEDNIERVIFVEVKTGQSKLNKREKSLKDTIERKKVSWKEINVDTSEKNTPDKKMENEETSIKELYEDIDNKLKEVKSKKIKSYEKDSEEDEEKDEESEDEEENDEEEADEENEEYEVECEKCGEEFSLKLEEEDNLEKGVKVNCPHCGKRIIVTEDCIL